MVLNIIYYLLRNVDKNMKISIIIPVPKYDGKQFTSLFNVCRKYFSDILEVIIAEGDSPSSQRNEAVKKATGDVLYFLDDDCVITEQHIIHLLELYKDLSIDAVGGPITTPENASFNEKLFNEIIKTLIGGYFIRYRYNVIGNIKPANERMLILANFSMRKKIFEEIGGFNNSLYPNEENELIVRLQKKGYKIFYDPKLAVQRPIRKSIPGFLWMCARNGRGRADCFFVNAKTFSFVYLLPLCFLLYIISLFWVRSVWCYMPLFIYFCLGIVCGFLIMLKIKSLKAGLVSFAIFPLMVLTYGAGIVWGVFKYILEKKAILKRSLSPADVKIYKICDSCGAGCN
jgi:GT2 family glycosyltransferase